MRRLLTVMISSTLFLGLAVTSASGSSGEDALDLRHIEKAPGEIYFTILDPEGSPYTSLALQPSGVGLGETRGQWKTCYAPNDPICLENPSARTGFLALGLCQDALDEDCVVNLMVSRDNQAPRSAIFLRRIESNLTMEADPSTNFPGGSTSSLWLDPDDPTKKYLVVATYGGNFLGVRHFSLNSINFSVIPVREQEGNYQAARIDKDLDPCCRIRWSSDYRALWTEDGRAGFRVNFEQDVELELTARVRSGISGWFKGRIKDPSIKISQFSPRNDLVEISGQPVSVAVMGVKRKTTEMTPKEYQWFQNNGSANGTSPSRPDADNVFNYINNFREDAKDTALGLTTAWSIGSTSWGNMNSCLDDRSRLVGIVSTNAMGFDGSSPRFVDGALEYKVSSLHFAPDGKTPLQGTYDLLLRSDVARCLYGFSMAPISASVSIVGSSENAITAVSSMTESDGWLKFGAYGFTFSEKTIRVTFLQEGSPKSKATKSSETAARKTSTKKANAVKCVKGKIVKRVANASQCPRGFQKR